MYDSSSAPTRKRTLKERLGSSSGEKLYLRLPDTARVLFEIFKDNSVLIEIVSRFGGCTLHVPSNWPPVGKRPSYKGHPLRKILTPAQMLKVVAHYGGTDLYVPRCTKYMSQMRNSSIVKEFSAKTRHGKSTGSTVQWLARRYNLSDRRIWSILKQSTESMI